MIKLSRPEQYVKMLIKESNTIREQAVSDRLESSFLGKNVLAASDEYDKRMKECDEIEKEILMIIESLGSS